MRRWPRRLAHAAIRAYQLTFSLLLGRRCRYLPTCSDYTDEAIARHGVWAGGWVGLVCGALAMYGSFALVTNATYGREVIPVGSR